MSAPARTSSEIFPADREAEPMVQTILARRMKFLPVLFHSLRFIIGLP
jgi:hypothetical protein